MTLHNVLFVQYIYLATEAQTYRKSCSLIYLVTYICPRALKSGRFSLFLMPNNFGTGQKKAYFFWYFRKLNHGQRTTFIKGPSQDSKKKPKKIGYTGESNSKMFP